MSIQSLEDRMTALEAEVICLKREMATQKPQREAPWWERRFGAFKDDPLYDEAMRLGAEYRKSQPTPCQ
jgi:hypothetical protein